MPPSPPRFVLLDGGVGHILKTKDPKGNTNFLGGALASEAAIREAHREFVAMGAEVLSTATFGVTPFSLKRAGIPDAELEGTVRRVARLAVEVAAEENGKREKQKWEQEGGVRGQGGRGGRGRPVLVAGCLPPLGYNCYLPSCAREEDEESAAAVYERIARALLEAGVDLFLVETCSGGRDAEAAARGAAAAAAAASSSSSSQTLLWLSFTVDDEEPSKLRGGEELEAAARRALERGAGGGGGGGGRRGGGGGEGRGGGAENRLPVSALLLNCSSPRAVSRALPLLCKVLVSDKGAGGGGARKKAVGLGCYANGFRATTTSWLRSEGVVPPPPPPPPSIAAAAAPSAAASPLEAAAEKEEEDFDEDGMITPEAYARHALGWVRSCYSSGGGGGSGNRSKSCSGGGEESSSSSSSSSFFVLGGCCGVTPVHIGALRSLLDSEEDILSL